MSKYKDLRVRHHEELKKLLLEYSHMTIAEASNCLGIRKDSLRKMAYDYGIAFEKIKGKGKTMINPAKICKSKNYRTDVSLPGSPWD